MAKHASGLTATTRPDYTPRHLSTTPRPACTCGLGGLVEWHQHAPVCAIKVEVRERLHLSPGTL